MTRYGILGFGHHAIKRLLPGFAGAHSSTVAGLWRRDPAKAEVTPANSRSRMHSPPPKSSARLQRSTRFLLSRPTRCICRMFS